MKKDIEELTEMYGLLCWQGYDMDPGGFKKLMWFEMMKEFNCKASSTWSVYGREREEAFTHRHLSPGKKEEISQLDYIIGPVGRDDEKYICIFPYPQRREVMGNMGPLPHLCENTGRWTI